jgi:twitching motility protein PilT
MPMMENVSPVTAQISQALSASASLNDILIFARRHNVSDVHLSAGYPVMMRQFTRLIAPTPLPLLPQQVEHLIREAIEEHLLSEFLMRGDLETIHIIDGAGRYRVTLTKHRRGWTLTARAIPLTTRTFAESGMPQACQHLTKWAQGLILITGPAGSGKSSTLTTLIEMINETRHDHIIIIEHPIEVLFTEKNCQITQREIPTHTLTQTSALKAALREDPDIIVVSELRDLASIQLAVTAAETGHLVLGTMNTNDAAQTVTKLIGSFPPEEQPIITNMISESLRGIICQQLIPRRDGQGVIPAFEVLIVNNAVANIIREGKTRNLHNAVSTGKSEGMVLLDHSLRDLVAQGIIEKNEAYTRAVNKTLFASPASQTADSTASRPVRKGDILG